MSELMKKAFKDRRAHQDNCPHRRDDGSSRLVHVQGDDEGFLICQFCLAVIFADNPRFHALTNLVTLIDTRLDLTPASEELDIHESDYQKWLMTAVHS